MRYDKTLIVTIIGVLIAILAWQFPIYNDNNLKVNQNKNSEVQSKVTQASQNYFLRLLYFFGYGKSSINFKKQVAEYIKIDDIKNSSWLKLKRHVYKYQDEFSDNFYISSKKLVDFHFNFLERSGKVEYPSGFFAKINKGLDICIEYKKDLNNLLNSDKGVINLIDEIKSIKKE